MYFLKVNVSADSIPKGRTVHNKLTFYAGPYYNMHMLWHLLFDFALPLFHTIQLFKAARPALVIPHSAEFPNSEIVKAFTSSVGRLKNNACYRDLVVGISKVKDWENGTAYEFPRNFTHLLHPLILKHFDISEHLPEKPVILVIGRRTAGRVVTNFNETIEMLQREFSGFAVRSIFFERLSMKEQIEAAYTASVMIGVHGSGLAHVAWMRRGTVMIEIFPYHFDCRDWYEKATVVSGVAYLKYVPMSEAESPNASPAVRECWQQANGCDGDCLDRLRDQNIWLNLSVFKGIVATAIASVSS
jgi:hypothetical protein